MRFRLSILCLTIMLFGRYGFVSKGQQREPVKKITEAEIKAVINAPSGECENLDQIHINRVEYYDFTGDGREEAVVVASTCMTGTAGPDVHAVYRRAADGSLVELPFLNAKGDPPLSNEPGADDDKYPVFGNSNFTLGVEDGMLAVRWSDYSDRAEPLTIWYKWDGAKFIVDHRKIQGPFPTGYDCAKAAKEQDRAICYSPSVAALDVKLGQVYGAALQQLPAGKRQALQAEQREWLAQREKQCPIYKSWVDCLTDLYAKRIAELKQQ